MHPHEISKRIDAYMSQHCRGDGIVDVETVLDGVLGELPRSERVDREQLRRRIMAHGIGYPAMRWSRPR